MQRGVSITKLTVILPSFSNPPSLGKQSRGLPGCFSFNRSLPWLDKQAPANAPAYAPAYAPKTKIKRESSPCVLKQCLNPTTAILVKNKAQAKVGPVQLPLLLVF